MKFKDEKHGYNKSQVDSTVNDLELQLANALKRNKELESELLNFEREQEKHTAQSKNISIALTAAVEKARHIEESSKNVYKLKIQQLEVLYKRFEALLGEMLEKYPNVKDVDNVKVMMNEFRSSIKNTLKDDFKITAFQNVNSNDPIRTLLSRMNDHFKKSPTPPKTVTIERKSLKPEVPVAQTDLERFEEKSAIIKPIYEKQLKNSEKFETLADQFLKEEPNDDVYAKKFASQSYPTVNESGFDLKEAVNPKDDLEEIMKAFDFYNDNDDNN